MKSWIELEAPEARDTQILDCMFINVTSMDVKHVYIVVRGDRQVESMIGDTYPAALQSDLFDGNYCRNRHFMKLPLEY